MQIAAQTNGAPASARSCRGHHGTQFVPVSTGDGRWVYYWLSIPQAWFWRSRNVREKLELIRGARSGCFVCNLQRDLERETFSKTFVEA